MIFSRRHSNAILDSVAYVYRKAWKKVRTKVANLIRCGINEYQAYEWGNNRKGYWRIADSSILKRAIDNNKLRSAGDTTLMGACTNVATG